MEEENKGRLALERNLQKAFKAVDNFHSPLQTALPEMHRTVSSVANILEQFECCKSLESNVPITSFSEVKAHLLMKLETEIESRLEDLRDKIEILKEKQEIVHKFCELSRKLMQKYSTSLGFAAVTVATPLKPSVSDMVEWLEDIDHSLFEQYHCKLHLLQEVGRGGGDGREVNSQNLLALWTDQDSALLTLIKDYLWRVGYFLEEKI